MGRPSALHAVESFAAKKQAILDSALALFADRGFHGTSIPDVIANAKVGASTLYRLYPSKEALVNAVFVQAKERLESALAQAEGAAHVEDPRAYFRELWNRLVKFARDEPTSFHFLELQDHNAYLDAQSRAVELRVLGPIFAACSELQAVDVFTRDVGPDVIMAFIWGAFVGLVKAERTGYIKLADETYAATCDASWRAFATEKKSSATKKKRQKKRKNK
jgi:TetR/AcrR family transcriptional regulator, repressor of fatR-cypB operon